MIIGLGTGRCGTKSLSKLLRVPHERGGPLPWKKDIALLEARYKGLRKYNGDVGFYYLPYVELLHANFKCRFVCLMREIDETIDSYMRWTEGYDLWRKHHDQKTNVKWDKAYPKYDLKSKREAIQSYWVEYYKIAEYYHRNWSNFQIFPMSNLNTLTGCMKIMEFARVHHKPVVGIRENVQ